MICESVKPPLSPSVMLQSPSKKHHRKIFNESKEETDPTYDMEYYNDVEKLQCCDPPIIVSEYSSSDYSIDNIRSQAIQDPEIDEVSLIERSYEKGDHQVRMVYAFRSVSRAIPDIVSCCSQYDITSASILRFYVRQLFLLDNFIWPVHKIRYCLY